MAIQLNQIYHIYNQGNNKQNIFFNSENYLYFFKHFEAEVLPHCELLAYCLMPNHFHFLVYTNEKSIIPLKIGSLTLTALSNGFRLLLSSYAKGINIQQGNSGSLFRQKTKYKLLEVDSKNYSFTCFNYIHQNPMKAKLVDKMENWPYSSFVDYWKNNENSICNKILAEDLIGFNLLDFYEESYRVILDDDLKHIF